MAAGCSIDSLIQEAELVVVAGAAAAAAAGTLGLLSLSVESFFALAGAAPAAGSAVGALLFDA
jgi:hypothetical protein